MPNNSLMSQEEYDGQVASGKLEPIDSAPITPGPGAAPLAAPGTIKYLDGSLPPQLQYSPDLIKTDYGPSTPSVRIMPVAPGNLPNVAAGTQSVIKASQNQGESGVLLETNGNTNPSQTTLNLVQGDGITLTTNSTGTVLISGSGGGDGLVHGDPIWDVDSAVAFYRDDFSFGTGSASSVGDLRWNAGLTNWTALYTTGTPPHLGCFAASINSGSSSAFGWISLPSASTNFSESAWDLLTNPGWKCVWVWKWDFSQTYSIPPTFDMSQKSFYIGLGYQQTTFSERPQIFLGIRFDTDTTAPAISDTTMKYEAVVNPLQSGNDHFNTQGTVVDTGIVPTQGDWYRLEIECTAVGVVTMSLNGAAAQSFIVPMVTISGTTAGSVSAGGGAAEYSLGGETPSWAAIPWAVGATVAVSGLGTFNAGLNQTGIVNQSGNGGSFFMTSPVTVGNNNAAFVAKGYPSLTPWLTWGNDSQATPTSNSAALYLDFFAFVWNGGIAGLTPNPTISRYYGS